MPNCRSTWALLAALFVAVAGCGGSGSSGFDIVAENNFIGSVLETMQCDTLDGLTICPIDSPPVQEPGATPAPGQGPRIDGGLGGIDALDCAPDPNDQGCRIQVIFSAGGFPSDAAFRVASREPESETGWSVFSPGGAAGDPQQPTFVTSVEVPSSDGEVQLAILVFLNPEAAVVGPIPTLGASGADYAFVTTPLEITALPPP